LWKTAVLNFIKGGYFMYYLGIDISKYKHDCFIISSDGEIIYDDLVIQNDATGFSKLLSIIDSLDQSQKLKIGFEATGHYGINLKLFLEKSHHNFMELNPFLLSKFIKGQTLRKTKSDAIDCRAIVSYLMTVEYKPHPIGFYHMYSLKSLTRLRDSLIRQRSFYMVKITNVLDHTFPEFKPFFKGKFTVTSLYILKKYGSAKSISNMNISSYEMLRKISHGKFSLMRFYRLKELATKTIGESNDILDSELSTLLALYKSVDNEIQSIEDKIQELIVELNPPTLSINGIGPLSAAVIVSEFGNISRFKNPGQMLSFAGMEPGYYQSGISEHTGKMVKRGSSQLRYTLMNVCLPLINNNPVFMEYYLKKRNEGKPYRVAINHVAKKLLRIIYTLETNQIQYDPSKLR
jgi:transposase